MKKNYLTYLLTSLMLISGCNTNVSSTSSNVNNKTSTEVIIKSPNEDGGLEGNQEDWIEETHSVFHKNSFFYVTPYVGFDYCMTKRIHLTFRLDWMLAFHQNELVMPTGPRLYFGFMFTH